MKPIPRDPVPRCRPGLLVLSLLLAASPFLSAQYETKSGVYNRLSQRIPANNPSHYPPVGVQATPLGDPVITPQYSNVVESSGGSSRVMPLTPTPPATSLTEADAYYPNAVKTVNGVKTGVMLQRSSFGTSFASGVPRYFYGDHITPPTAIINTAGSSTPITDPANYWRAEPVRPGETLTNPGGGPIVDYRTGASAVIPALAEGVMTSYYYSPHAKVVFANTPGQVEITWRSSVPDPTTNNYVFYKETFTVSSATSSPVRTMFWTEKSFNGPRVTVPSGRIVTVNPVYSNVFPETVATEYVVAGSSGADPNAEATKILRTLWYEKSNGVGELHAYNLTGRILVEYLGTLRDDGTHEFLGADVISVEQAAQPSTLTVKLGNQIVHGTQSGQEIIQSADEMLTALPVTTSSGSNQTYYGSNPLPDGSLAYYAERENDIEDRVVFYWLEKKDAAIPMTDGNTPGLAISWPKYLNKYLLVWPSNITDFASSTVPTGGSSVDNGTGLQFQDGKIPQIIYQDAPLGSEALIDTITQRFIVNLGTGGDQKNRTLLKFVGSNGGVWYVRLVTQAAGRTDYQEGDGGTTALTGSVYVGDRIAPPSSDYSIAGYVAGGKAYSPAAYIDPFANGVEAAEKGAIIPVNALPAGENALSVWWFRKVKAPSAEFSDFYTPAKIGSYSVAYRTGNQVANENFNTAATGWTKSTLTASGNGSFFGPFAVGDVLSKSYPITGDASQGVKLAFTFHRIDSWDAEKFQVSLNGFRIIDTAYDMTEITSTLSGSSTYNGINYTWSVAPIAGTFQNFYGATATWKDQSFKVNIQAKATGTTPLTSLNLSITSTLNQAVSDEAFAIDDLTLDLPLPDQIILASNQGTGSLSSALSAGSIYNQPDPTKPGYNPNEEHALMVNGRGYALRDDLNLTAGVITGSTFTSLPRALIQYTNSTDGRPSIAVYEVLRESPAYPFSYPVTAGTILSKPLPLPLMPLPVDANGNVKNAEVAVYTDIPTAAGAPASYSPFTFKDRKGYDWVYRGPHKDSTPSLGMKFYYTMRGDFYFPNMPQPAVGTILPYLRAPNGSGGYTGDAVSGESLTISYYPTWPANPPVLSVGETLSLPAHGLPAVRGQTSARVLYQQSIANNAAASVTLHDATRAKSVLINNAAVGMTALPVSLKTTSQNGKTYFQLAQPHLQQRFYFDPLLGDIGGLVLTGVFHDEIAGEDYLDLNTLSDADVAALKILVDASDKDKARWDTAVTALTTVVETFKENPSSKGTYIVDSTKTVNVGAQSLPEVSYSDTAVDSYALTAQGKGDGYVTLLFGDGVAFTPQGEPVAMQVIKVQPKLYQGDLKMIAASNPLDEQTSLRHSSDFAARPQDYEFEWRYSPPLDGMAPPVYSYDMASYLKNSQWYKADNPKNLPDAVIAYPGTTTGLTSAFAINTAAYDPGLGFPGQVLKSATGLDFTAGVPSQVIFSTEMGSADGFTLYVNHKPVLAYHIPGGMSVPGGLTPQAPRTGLAPGGLHYQFSVDPTAFTESVNVIEVALYSTTSPGNTASTIGFQFDAPHENDLVVPSSSPWFLPSGTFSNTIVIGGSAASPLGDPLLVFSDTYFTMRYRAKTGANLVTGTKWSEWMQPVLVESWVKRVLDGINPFNQRQTDLYNNPVSTDVSILTQAGKRWEGDVALNLSNINDFGLIEIYETVLNRVKKQSLDGNISTDSVNSTLLLVAGYLNDLYMTLGNEAWDDAQNPTILIDGDTESSDISSARFSFEGQVATMMDETLGLLRGRDDFLSPGTRTTPSYNRLYWNYTNGISSGEPIYAVNYDIKEKAGGPYADGVLDASDAYYMFPQGHGDAYGHYLTALTGYYKLLTASAFDWKPSTEGVTVLGQTVQVDYKDERKFAAAAAAVARTGEDIIDFTARANHQEGEEHGWADKHDGKYNSSTGRTRYWGTDEWCSRVSQGAYYNWVSANAMLPDIDKDHEGIQKIDRTTVPELNELVDTAQKVLSLSAGEQAHLNPLGLAADAMTFDISPALLAAGKSHFEQIYDRAVKAAVNAKNAFHQAGKMNRLLRSQNNSLDDYNEAITRQEAAYEYQLTTLFGTAYAGDIGPGKLYAQGYTGPDLYHSYFIDRPSTLVDTSADLTVTFREPVNHDPFKDWSVDNVYNRLTDPVQYVNRTYRVSPFSLGQFSDTVTGSLGKRGQPGRIQAALLDAYEAQVNLRESSDKFNTLMKRFDRDYQLYSEFLTDYDAANAAAGQKSDMASAMSKASLSLSSSAAALSLSGELIVSIAEASAEGQPKAVGLANDTTFIGRMIAMLTGATSGYAQQLLGMAASNSAAVLDAQAADLEGEAQSYIDDYNFDSVKKQHVVEFEKLYDEILSTSYEITSRLTQLQRATEKVSSIYAEANHILSDRETFRQRAASVIQGYRTRDVVYRDFRNEELAQYKSLFDLAQTYAHCAAMAYDYETGLLNSELGEDFISDIIGTYSIGDWSGENPVESGSGDSGLASILSNLRDEWEIVEGRLGINNPDRNGTVFSLRQELFRIRTDQPTSDDNLLWKQVLQQHMMSNVLNDPDVAMHCSNIAKTNGGAVPGIVISFGTTIEQGLNFFGWPLAAGDHTFSQSTFATKIYSSGLIFKGYVGMDPYSIGTPGAAGPASSATNALSATPYAYLIPAGNDTMRAPPLGDANIIRSWAIKDQALPLPKNLGANSFSSSQFFTPQGSLNEQLWITRKHQAFRAVDDQAYFYSSMPAEFTNSRLVGRSAWNTQWKIVIPAYSLLSDEQTGLDRFAQSVSDIKLFLRTYSNSGN